LRWNDTKVKISLLILLLVATPTWATDSFAPKLDIGKGGQCVEEPQWMRKNHMHVLLQQRDETVHQGKRDGKYSLKNCIECHASTKDNSVIGRADSFCEGCHRYEAVKIDCFECHSGKRKSTLAQKEPK
jgi:cytochrome c553